MAQYVKLGSKASFFRAASIDLSIAPGEVVALNVKQMNNRLVKRALQGGHLVLTAKEDTKQKVELTPEELKESFMEMVGSGDDAKKISKNFSMSELKTIAAVFDIEVEADDKKVDVVMALLNEVGEPEEEDETEEPEEN